MILTCLPMFLRRRLRIATIVAGSLLGFAAICSAQFSVLHAFPAPGPVRPYAPLVQANDGNFYGTTAFGGISDQGAVFRMTPAGVVTIMHEFLGAPTDGGQPYGSLVQAADGHLYGTTWDGGAGDRGSIFRMTLAGAVTIVHSFTAGTHGSFPLAALIIGSDNSFYGTASQGGTNGVGTLFKFTLPNSFTVLRHFSLAATDGAYPYAPVMQGADGNLYGTTRDGGASQLGTVFKIATNGTGFALLHSFNGTNGRYPVAAVVQHTDTNLYGTTSGVGGGNLGTVFRVTLAGAHTLLKSFQGGDDTREPVAALLQTPEGDFLGTTSFQGTAGTYYGGRVFRITTAGAVTPIHDFNNANGGWPSAGLIRGIDGQYYGTTSRGGTSGAAGAGTVYRISSNNAFTLMHSFDGGSGGARPRSPMIRATDGNLYGNTVIGGHADLGVIFKMTPAGAMTHLHSIDGVTDSQYPQSNFSEDPDGDFYGGIQPVIYKMKKDGTFTILFVMDAVTQGDGANNLVRHTADGNYYGTTDFYGLQNNGTIFKVTKTGVFTLLYTFTGGAADGGKPSPNGKLIQGADGQLYGTTTVGGAGGVGTIFKITTTGTFTLLHSFNNATEGAGPRSPLMLANDGNFWGVTPTGAASNVGAVFKMTPAGAVTVMHPFTGNSNINVAPLDGASGYSGLVQAPTGTMYGTTALGGAGGVGTVYSMTTTGTFAVVHSFTDGAGGSGPAATPTLAPGGHLYGTTVYGGLTTGLGMGVVWHLTIPGLTFTDDPLIAGTTVIKAVHVMELRSRIDTIRAANGLAAFSWGAAVVAGNTITAQHLIDLRTALAQAYTQASRTPPSYTDPGLTVGTLIKAIHITELRTAVTNIE